MKRMMSEGDTIKYKHDGESKEMPADSAKKQPDDHPAKKAWLAKQSGDSDGSGEKVKGADLFKSKEGEPAADTDADNPPSRDSDDYRDANGDIDWDKFNNIQDTWRAKHGSNAKGDDSDSDHSKGSSQDSDDGDDIDSEDMLANAKVAYENGMIDKEEWDDKRDEYDDDGNWSDDNIEYYWANDDAKRDHEEGEPKDKAPRNVDDFVVQDGDSFYIDAEDIDTGEAIVKPGDEVTFTHDGNEYTGIVTDEAEGRDDDVLKIDIDTSESIVESFFGKSAARLMLRRVR